jgi:hypothetical protein
MVGPFMGVNGPIFGLLVRLVRTAIGRSVVRRVAVSHTADFAVEMSDCIDCTAENKHFGFFVSHLLFSFLPLRFREVSTFRLNSIPA